jgi:hypothetical protein
MSKHQNRVAKLCGLAALAFLTMGTNRASALAIWDGVTPASNDSTSWGQLGGDGTTLGAIFSATSAGGNAVSGTFAGGAGEVVVAGGPNWRPVNAPFVSGDSLVWAFNNATNAGTGPLTLSFGNAVLAGGLLIQEDLPGAFTAQVAAFNGVMSLGTETVTSTNGNPVFIGAQDLTADITSLVFSLTSCSGQNCDIHDFAVDTLRSINPTVTVPAPLIGRGLPVFLAISGLLFGAKLLARGHRAVA